MQRLVQDASFHQDDKRWEKTCDCSKFINWRRSEDAIVRAYAGELYMGDACFHSLCIVMGSNVITELTFDRDQMSRRQKLSMR